MKDELAGKITIELVALRPKTCLMDDDSEAKKTKGTKKCIIKRMLKFLDYKNYLLNNKIILKSQQIFKSERHNVYTEKVSKRLQTYDIITSYPYETSAGKVCETEILSKVNMK